MYEAVRVPPEGESTLARHAATAARQGYEGVVVRNGQRVRGTHDDPEAYVDAVGDRYGVDVVLAAEIDVPDRSRASGHLGSLRPEYLVVLVRGGPASLSRFAASTPRVDVLAAPTRGEADVDAVLVREAAANDVALEFDLSVVLRAEGGRRVRAVQSLRKLRELVAHYGAPFVVTADPRSHLELRAPRELVAVGEQVGFDPDTVRAGLAAWGEVLARNRRRDAESFIGPGVERGPYDEES